MKKGLSVTLIMVLVISVAANFFSFNKLTSAKEETSQKAKLLLEEKEQEIGKLNDEISSLEKEKQSAAGNANTEKVEEEVKGTATENEAAQSGGQKDLVNSAERFIDYIYNVTPDNFAMVKQNADLYMTDEMIKTLFPSDGIDEKGSDLKTSASDIKVFMEGEGNKQAVVSYNFELEFISSGYKEKDSSYVLLDFEQEGGTYKVSKLTPINSMKGEISSIDAIGYLKGGGMLP